MRYPMDYILGVSVTLLALYFGCFAILFAICGSHNSGVLEMLYY